MRLEAPFWEVMGF